MEPGSPYRPRVSRETRRLLIAGAAAIAVLWLLARIRFEDVPAINPVPSVLSQLNTGPQFEALASEIGDLQGRLLPLLLAVDVGAATAHASEARRRTVAMRWRDDFVLALLPRELGYAPPPDLDVRASDPATHLAVVRVAGENAVLPRVSWTPRREQQPRYFIASDVTSSGVSLRPVFVGALIPTAAVAWPGMVWTLPSRTALLPGSFLFTTAGEFVGLSIAIRDGVAIVPGDTLLAEAERLLAVEPRPAGTIAIAVQALTEPIAALTGAKTGVVVTSIERGSSASKVLNPGDVIEAVDGRPLVSREDWDARIARLAGGQVLLLRVRRRGEVRDIPIAAQAVEAGAADARLGLTLQRRRGVGAEVTTVQPASAADRAGLSVGDVITLFGDVQAPTPAQITRSFTALQPGERLMVAVARGDSHSVIVLGR